MKQREHTKVEKKFLEIAAYLSPGGELYLWPNDAIAFLKECEKEKYRIYGIDGMWIHENGAVQPDMNHEINFSTKYETMVKKNREAKLIGTESDYYRSSEVCQTAIEFIKKRALLKNLSFIVIARE